VEAVHPWSALPGLPNGRYYFVNRTAFGTASAGSITAATFAVVVEHDKVGTPGERCSVAVVDATREGDVGLWPNNSLVTGGNWGWRDPIVCPEPGCGLVGSITRREWVPG
jgi:hypothetical protein